jgi:DNA-binding winged helix-turn-helix (wHTH) protein/Tol biopolymer transport system component
MANEVNNLYEFGGFRFDGGTHRLWQNGDVILLSPKASGLLSLLLERQGEFVPKEEIFEKVWTDTFVEDGVLTQNIYTLRKALGTDENGQPLIENRTRLGYRITVPVRAIERSNGDAESNDRVEENLIAAQTSSEIPAEEDSPKTVFAKKTRNWKKTGAIFAACLVLLSFAAFFGWRFLRPRIAPLFRASIERVRFEKLTNTGDLFNASLSPDGNFLVYIKNDRIYLKDIASGKDIALDIPGVTSFSSVQFSADGNFLYFRNRKLLIGHADVYRVSRFGGETKLIVSKLSGDFGLSSDGKFIAYVRSFPSELKQQRLIVQNLETGEEREIYASEAQSGFLLPSPPAFSPDGKKIAFLPPGEPNYPQIIDVENGNIEELKIPEFHKFEYIAWHRDGESLIVSADDRGKLPQLWEIYYPGGGFKQLTNALTSFTKVSQSADGKKMIAVQSNEFSNIYTAESSDLNEQKQLTFGNANQDGQETLAWLDDERIVYPSRVESNVNSELWLLNSIDGGRQQLTSNGSFGSTYPYSDGNAIYFMTDKDHVENISRMEINGGNVAPITEGADGLHQFPNVSPDGKYLYYLFRGAKKASIKRIDLAETREEVFFENDNIQPILFMTLSADGKYLAFPVWRSPKDKVRNENNARIGILSTENPADIKIIEAALTMVMLRLTADGKAIEYVSGTREGTQIMRQNVDGGEPQTIFALPKEKIFNFAWSKSGTRIAFSRGQSYKDAILLTEFE